MGLDVDYIAARDSINELKELVSKQEHGKREKIADDIIDFVEKMKLKWRKSHSLDELNSSQKT